MGSSGRLHAAIRCRWHARGRRRPAPHPETDTGEFSPDIQALENGGYVVSWKLPIPAPTTNIRPPASSAAQHFGNRRRPRRSDGGEADDWMEGGLEGGDLLAGGAGFRTRLSYAGTARRA